MKAKGFILRTRSKGVNYYYSPSLKKWLTDLTKLTIGDTYFFSIKMLLRAAPALPLQEDFPDLPSEDWEHVEFTIQTDII